MKANWQLARIGKQYAFSAAHHLPKVASGHPCKRMHGHNYLVEVEFRGEIAPKDGFCGNLDYADMDSDVKPVIEKLDHRLLNDFIDNPTAELIAAHILACINSQRSIYYSVKVWETPKCWAMVVNPDGYFHPAHRD
jgi:6-pyruvoyltetrahydropterin/6-carboxytetrahydropterin synthase